MKSDLNSQLKPNLIKKQSKPLNEKKNSIAVDNTLKKQRSKPNLTLNDTQTSSSTIQKLASPKNLTGLLSAISPKTEGNEELFKSQKSDLKKTGITTKPKKALLSKHEPIKKQFLPSLRSPKGTKNTSIQSELVIGSQQQKSTLFNEQSHLNIELDTSIARIDQVQDSIMSQEIHISQTSRKQMPTLQESKIEELSKTSKEQSQEILRLKQKNDELQRKLNKIKASQDQNRKRLKSRISTFNEEKEELLQYKEKISELQNLVAKLQSQNKELINSTTSHLKISQKIVQVKQCEQCSNRRQNVLSQSNKTIQIQIFPQRSASKSQNTKNQMVDESVMTSFQDSICDGVLSFINGNSSCKLQESILSNQKAKQSFTESENVIPPFQVEFIKNSYEEKYKQKISMIESFYKESLKDIESRFQFLLKQTSDIIKSQQRQMMSLENKIDDLYQKLESCVCQSKGKSVNFPSIETDEEKLKYLMQINQFKQKLSKKDDSIKQCRQQIHNKQIQCKKVAAELDIERIKYNLNFESGNLQKQIIELAQNEQYDILKEELKQQKEKNLKLSAQNSKKQELIKKLSAYHSSNTAITKKVIRK